jgi:CheY-like chemotaxis protein
MSRAKQPVYSIGAVAKMLGLQAQTIRTWQERYGVVVPERSAGGHRLYSRDQLEQLRFLGDQVAAGLSPGDAHRLLTERLASGGVLPAMQPSGRSLLILLAERDPYAAEFSEYFLRTEGYDVALVLNDADAAFTEVAERSPDVVVVDLLISGGKGLQLCSRLRERGADVPILAISTFELRDKALEAGAYAFLLKPIEPLQLVSTVQDLLGRSAFINRRDAGS